MSPTFLTNLFCILLPALIVAQTSVNPMIAYDFQKLNYSSASIPPGANTITGSGCIGLGLEQGINHFIGIAIESDYTRKQIQAPINTYAGISGLSLTQFRNTVSLRFYAHQHLHFSIGASSAFWSNVIIEPKSPYRPTYARANHWSMYGAFRLKIRPMFLEFYAYKWLPGEDQVYSSHILHDNFSFGAKLGSSILIFKQREKDRVRCPKF